MDWQSRYTALTEADKEEFARVMSLLFEHTFIVRDEWDPKQGRLVTNRDYRFVERNLELFHAYLQAGGFELQADGRRGVMAVYNRFGRNRMKVDKYTTYLLYVLRLIYEEEMERASMRREVVVTLQHILEKLMALGLMDRRIAATHLTGALNRLRRLHVLARIEGFAYELESRWMIYPTIEVAVPDERINPLYQRLTAGEFGPLGEGAGAGEDKETDAGGDAGADADAGEDWADDAEEGDE
ncbi:MAG: DUF4194 domain-containing protein [Alicyclobacillus macrosporangiidus]|uniref:DUF4194 domain-containing protein n=1 Tax=Alicyclobacillus macrosporangiidus TaxID=392015 RepID=UPI0026EBDA4D|nr:DUF4194 domain-containing protein [Alicyclobacillus macrosporangiidus]MCL6601017.1 DUF4194 domain-containing protein [Alicyclobacillus macrosporangiidus]